MILRSHCIINSKVIRFALVIRNSSDNGILIPLRLARQCQI
jgi:hypothetical protein